MSSRSWRTPDRGRLAETRERFLVRDPVEPNQVRDPILASWWRSREWNVPADRIELSYVRDPDLDTPLTRAAMPVLRHLRENVEGQPISVILTDPAGVVLTRMTADHDLERHQDARIGSRTWFGSTGSRTRNRSLFSASPPRSGVRQERDDMAPPASRPRGATKPAGPGL